SFSKSPCHPPLEKGEIFSPLFLKEGRGEIFQLLLILKIPLPSPFFKGGNYFQKSPFVKGGE
ncbi:MAG: hypothetical protein NC902_06910, partial [Candidatus Omnitrophica bacterium]|nr:hypothetical protein [Candidatus Omnitrophota bacterium]